MWKSSRVLGIAVLMLLCGCSSGGRPGIEIPPEVPDTDISIAYLKSMYAGDPVTIKGNYRVKGAVVSTDRYGNYYKTIAVQDDTGGIEIKIDNEKLFTIYRPGDIVEVHCNGLTLGSYGGVVQLGTAPADGYETGYMDGGTASVHIRITGVAESLPVVETAIPRITAGMVSCRIGLRNVQFCDDCAGETWGGEEIMERELTDIAGNRLRVRVSPHATFAWWALPVGRGSIEGILSYFNGEYRLVVVSIYDVAMSGERF